jgi:methylthioxylose transferase
MLTRTEKAQSALNAAFLLVSAVVVLLTGSRSIVFGSISGGWTYSYVSGFRADAVLTGAIVGGAAAALLWYGRTLIDGYELMVVGGWVAVGFAGQMVLHFFYVYSLADIVRSQNANPFYNVSLAFKSHDFLSQYRVLMTSMPAHVRANMPGKVLFYEGLRVFTENPAGLGILIVGISDLGGVLVYLLVKELYNNRATSLSSLILYLFIPAKLYFLPLLNVVSAIPIILALLLLLRFLGTARRMFGLFLGFALYAAAFFDPLTLTSAPFFLVLIVRSWRLGQVGFGDVLTLLGWAGTGFAIPEIGVCIFFHFELFRGLAAISADARQFYINYHRPYGVWLGANLLEFFLNAGAASSIACLVYAAVVVGRRIRSALRGTSHKYVRSRYFGIGSLMLPTFFATVAALDLSGIIRGEVVRLWIFLAIFLQITAADFCELAGPGTAEVVVFCSIVQTAAAISAVGFIL